MILSYIRERRFSANHMNTFFSFTILKKENSGKAENFSEFFLWRAFADSKFSREMPIPCEWIEFNPSRIGVNRGSWYRY